ncbi:hypothetical protein ACWC2T_23805 [Streptomyces sp. NPDC001393]
MVTRINRHEFRTDDADDLIAPIAKSSEDGLAHLETSEDDRYDALSATLTLAKWRCLAIPTEFPTWAARVTAMQVGCGLLAAGTAAEGPVPCPVGSSGEVKQLPATAWGTLADARTWHQECWTANEARGTSGEGLVALGPPAALPGLPDRAGPEQAQQRLRRVRQAVVAAR